MAEGHRIIDWLMPEWASLRMTSQDGCVAGVGTAPPTSTPRLMVSGPTSLATRIEVGSAAIWEVGLLPLGWTRLVGAPASDFADRLHDGHYEPVFAPLAPVYDLAFGRDPAPVAFAARLEAFFTTQMALSPPPPDEDRIRAAHRLLIDEDIGAVSEFAERLGLSPRTLERFCLRVFGFSPKLLLRRQRFTPSLAEFLLDPTLKWISTLDHHYVDQAHFVRDFRRFMGMSPSAYSGLDHPILSATTRLRASMVGGAVQALHRP